VDYWTSGTARIHGYLEPRGLGLQSSQLYEHVGAKGCLRSLGGLRTIYYLMTLVH